MELDCLLHLLDGALEIPLGLRTFLVGARLGWVSEEKTGIIILILRLHLLELLVVMLLAVIINVVTGGESLPVARHRGILLCAACSVKNAAKKNAEDVYECVTRFQLSENHQEMRKYLI